MRYQRTKNWPVSLEVATANRDNHDKQHPFPNPFIVTIFLTSSPTAIWGCRREGKFFFCQSLAFPCERDLNLKGNCPSLIDLWLEHFPFSLVKHQNLRIRVVLVAAVTSERLFTSAQWYWTFFCLRMPQM
jgi:hypothetical protein